MNEELAKGLEGLTEQLITLMKYNNNLLSENLNLMKQIEELKKTIEELNGTRSKSA